jgi:hypothetical protein
MDNVYPILQRGVDLDIPLIQSSCTNFALMNPEFFTSKNAKTLSFEAYQRVVTVLTDYYQTGREKLKPSMIKASKDNTDPIHRDFEELYNCISDTGDVEFDIGDKIVKAHRCILSSFSASFDALLQTYQSNQPICIPIKRPHESASPRVLPHDPTDHHAKKRANTIVYYKNLNPSAFQSLLKYIYYGEKNFSLLEACQLLPFVIDYKLTDVQNLLEKKLKKLPITSEAVLFVLEIAETVMKNSDVKKSLWERSLTFVHANLPKIDFRVLEAMPAPIAADLILSLQRQLLQNWSVFSPILQTEGKLVNLPSWRKADRRNSGKRDDGLASSGGDSHDRSRTLGKQKSAKNVLGTKDRSERSERSENPE